jgi:branched-chain amino acid transport system substrate-binding protein
VSDSFANLVTRTEPKQRLGIPGRPFDPIRIGFLVDFWMPDSYIEKMYVQPILLAFEEAVAEGHSIRAIELVVDRAFALPQNRWENALHGLRRLREAGCVGVIGPLVSDNARTLREAINGEIQLPCVTWAGTSDWYGDYCFRLGNGGCTEEGQMMASWLAHKGLTKVGVMSEISPNGQEYFLAFRRAAAELGLEIRGVETITQTPVDLEQRLANLREGGAEAIAYMGFGFPTSLMRPMFERLAWDPPRIMTTAFQFCYANPAWMKALVGWVGIDQVCEENPLYGRFLERFEKHWGRPAHSPNTVPVLAYDSARVFTEAIRRADGILTGPGIKAGLERTRFAPSATGGPRTHIGAAPDDHNLFHGDWLLYRRVAEEGDRAFTVFEGTWQPNV